MPDPTAQTLRAFAEEALEVTYDCASSLTGGGIDERKDASAAFFAALDAQEQRLQRVTALARELADGRGWILDKIDTALLDAKKDGPQ